MPASTTPNLEPDPHVIAELLRQAYGIEPILLDMLGNDPTGERVTYRLVLDDGHTMMLRGYRAGSRVPSWHGGGTAETWLHERAQVLDWLAERGYPAPRVIPTCAGDPIATHSGYCVLAMTYIPGQPLPASVHRLERLASNLGQLHSLGPLPNSGGVLPDSWWQPLDQAVAPLLDNLERARADVPLRWRALHTAFATTLGTFAERGDLPLAAIHGDCHPANVVETRDEQVVLIDWDCAGQGTAVLDLGVLLLDAQPDPAPGDPVTVDEDLVARMVASYRLHREPTALECESLLEATRFGVAFLGSLRFAWANEQSWTERIEGSLLRLQARYIAAEQVARLAQGAFDEHN